MSVNPEGYSHRTVFNEFGLPALTTDEDGHQTRYTYDARRNLTSVTTPEGRGTAWEYDKCDHVVLRTLPGGESYAYTYEGSDLTTITDSEGRTFTLAYNERHELIRLTFPYGLHRDWRYDGRGRMVWARDGERKCDNLRRQQHAGATITRQQAVCERFCSPLRRWLHHPSRCRLCQSYPSQYKGR